MTKTAPTRLAVTSTLPVIAAYALLLGTTVAASASTFLVTVEQVGGNVVVTGSGSFDLTDLNSGGLTSSVPADINGPIGLLNIGPVANGTNNVDSYFGFTGPASFGSAFGNTATTGSGATVGMEAQVIPQDVLVPSLLVPHGYVSGKSLSDSATYDNTTISGLGLTPGTYIWMWGTGADQGTFELQIGETPLPAALPLFATGLGALGLLGWRRKRKLMLLKNLQTGQTPPRGRAGRCRAAVRHFLSAIL